MNKIQWTIGYSNLSLILEQDRKHWLMKTDKKKQIQDKYTGDMFLGQIDNIGSDILLTTEKLPILNKVTKLIGYKHPSAEKILSIERSPFPFTVAMNGLLYARIVSTNFQTTVDGVNKFNHYRIKFVGCQEVMVPLSSDKDSNDVYMTKWLKSSTNPILLMQDENGSYTIEQPLEFNDDVTGVIYYYPVNDNIQPVNITESDTGVYISDTINDDDFIGYPLYWFTCDQSKECPDINISNNISINGKQLVFIGNEGVDGKYISKIYFGVDGDFNATPDDTSTDNFDLVCRTSLNFNDTSINEVPLDHDLSVFLVNRNTDEHYYLDILCDESDLIITVEGDGWTIVDDHTCSIPLNTFDSNCMSSNSKNKLIPTLKVQLKDVTSINDTDLGYAGIRISASGDTSDIYRAYPYELNKWSGLPEWLNNNDGSSQHITMYAIHNTPTYIPGVPDTRQVAAILLDPGKKKTDDHEGFNNDEIGRAYLLSNDNINYENNSVIEHPKPERTIARICDIPTSVMQLSDIRGIAPSLVVDKKYVRTEASYKNEDKERLYNTLANRWVVPTDLDENGEPLTNKGDQKNNFIFMKESYLYAVDLANHNDYRYYENLNPQVDVTKLKLANIDDIGSGYSVGNSGKVIIGGSAINYSVTEVDNDGGVTGVIIYPDENLTTINLSNFDMMDDSTGTTESYGSAPDDPNVSGKGLRLRFYIEGYNNIITRKGKVLDGLYALVRVDDGLWMYDYSESGWIKSVQISQFEPSSNLLSIGGLSTREAYLNSIIPSIRSTPVCESNRGSVSTLTTLSTSSFVNIIDNEKTPISTHTEDHVTPVDICRFHCDGLNQLHATTKTIESIISILRANHKIRFDSYLIWKWVDENDPSNTDFIYGTITRGFNNLQSTDSTTLLPVNDLIDKAYVHTNSSTTMVWDTKNVGAMMWMYNPKYNKRERYHIDDSTHDLYITKNELLWTEIPIFNKDNVTTKLVANDGTFNFNIMTNNPMCIEHERVDDEPIYLQPDMEMYISKGERFDNLPEEKRGPIGNWQLVFPRIQSFKLTNIDDGREFTPIQLQLIRGANMGDNSNIVDENGNNVNSKTLVIEEKTTSAELRAYNSETGNWDIL